MWPVMQLDVSWKFLKGKFIRARIKPSTFERTEPVHVTLYPTCSQSVVQCNGPCQENISSVNKIRANAIWKTIIKGNVHPRRELITQTQMVVMLVLEPIAIAIYLWFSCSMKIEAASKQPEIVNYTAKLPPQ